MPVWESFQFRLPLRSKRLNVSEAFFSVYALSQLFFTHLDAFLAKFVGVGPQEFSQSWCFQGKFGGCILTFLRKSITCLCLLIWRLWLGKNQCVSPNSWFDEKRAVFRSNWCIALLFLMLFLFVFALSIPHLACFTHGTLHRRKQASIWCANMPVAYLQMQGFQLTERSVKCTATLQWNCTQQVHSLRLLGTGKGRVSRLEYGYVYANRAAGSPDTMAETTFPLGRGVFDHRAMDVHPGTRGRWYQNVWNNVPAVCNLMPQACK